MQSEEVTTTAELGQLPPLICTLPLPPPLPLAPQYAQSLSSSSSRPAHGALLTRHQGPRASSSQFTQPRWTPLQSSYDDQYGMHVHCGNGGGPVMFMV